MQSRRLASTLLIVLALAFHTLGVAAQDGVPTATPGDTSIGDVTDSPQTATPADVNVQAAGDGYLYALVEVFNSSNQIYGFQVNELTGALTALSGFPVATGGNGDGIGFSEQLVYDAGSGRLYAINDGSETLSAYSVNLTTGGLTALPFNPISLGIGFWACAAVHPSGSPVIVGNGSGGFTSINITSSTAITATGSPFNTGTALPYSCAFSRDGAHVYGGGSPGTSIAGFSVNAATGVLAALSGSPFNSGNANPVALTTDSVGRIFTTNATAAQVRAFTTSSGVPSPVSGNPFASNLSLGVHAVLHPLGYYMVADRSGNRVGVYRISGSGPSTTLAAVSGSPFASGGSFTDVLALNRSGAFLYAANGNTRNITTFSVNGGTGELLSLGTQITNTLGTTGRITGMSYVPGLNYVFLPLILKNYTHVPLPTLQNANFDQGHVAWTESSIVFPGNNLLFQQGVGGAPAAHSGTWLAWLGGADNEVSELLQQIAVPNGVDPFYLYFRYQIGSDETNCNQVTPSDTLTFRIDNSQVDGIVVCSAFNTGANWTEFSFVTDLSAYAGQTITLGIRVTTNSSLNSNVFLDSLQFSRTPPPLTSATSGLRNLPLVSGSTDGSRVMRTMPK